MPTARELLANNLKFLRAKKNISRYRLAKDCGISTSYISEIEKGDKANPSFDLIDILAAYFGVEPYELFLNFGKEAEIK